MSFTITVKIKANSEYCDNCRFEMLVDNPDEGSFYVCGLFQEDLSDFVFGQKNKRCNQCLERDGEKK